ncbi:hypothetical protein D3C75_553540 [compost metagenome]
MTDADRPDAAAHIAELQGRTVAVGLRSFTAQMVEAPALTVPLIAKLLGKTTCVEVRTTLAVLVDQSLVGKQRTLLAIQRRQLAVGDVVGNRGEEVVGIGRATRDIDDGGADIAEGLFEADGAGRVAPAGRHTAPGGAGADGDDRSRIGGGTANMVDDGLTGHHAVDTAILERNGAIHHQHILAFITLDGVVLVLFRLMTKGRREHLVVLQRDGVEDQVFYGGVGGAQQ